jgi:hypothetical protein
MDSPFGERFTDEPCGTSRGGSLAVGDPFFYTTQLSDLPLALKGRNLNSLALQRQVGGYVVVPDIDVD